MPDEPPHFGSVEPPKKPELPATVTSEEELGEKKATMTSEEELGEKKATMTPEEELGGKKATMTPEEELSEEKIKLEEITKAIEKKNVEKSASDKKIADLDKKINDVTKVVEAYKKEYENIIKVKNGLDEYCTEWYPIIGNRIPDNRKAFINDTIKNFKIETDNLRHSIEEEDGELRKNYKLAKKDFDDAQKALNDKQSEYDKLKKRQNEIEEVIKDIQNLKSMIDKSDEAIDAEKGTSGSLK